MHAPIEFAVLRPVFRWTDSTCDSGECAPDTFEIQVDDSCSLPGFRDCAFPSPEASAAGLMEQSWQPTADLPVDLTPPVGRRYYWRVRRCRAVDCSAWSAVRFLDVGRVAADVNGDGFADILVGAEGSHPDPENLDRAYLYLGGPGGVPTDPSFSLESPVSQPDDYFGHSVASAGDVNADRYADIVVGAYWQAARTEKEGHAFIYHGRATGLSMVPAASLDNPAHCRWGQFGQSVATAGDVNGDGYADVLIGANGQDGGADDEGGAFVYLGSASGIASRPSMSLDNPDNDEEGDFGVSVAGAGDVDADGYADIIVGAMNQSNDSPSEGNAFVYRGGPAGVPTSPSSRIDNPTNQRYAHFGVSVAGVGDLNGDGYSDVAVGAFYQDSGTECEGNAFVYHGGPSGIPVTPSTTLDNPAGEEDGQFGRSVATSRDGGGAAVPLVCTHGTPDAMRPSVSTPPGPDRPEALPFPHESHKAQQG
ncbi:MAG: VCBS repeat-containing protein [Deltaproteobacteria bacterium]|nr:VCBS repeat-containing protein [Deltaproteobacteria bacterium]